MAAILIIDPSATIRETLRIVLGGEHAVSVASSWDEATADAPPDLVIFGAPPPPRDDAGAAALRARLAPEAPLLLLNAANEIDPRALAPARHRVELLPKPFDAQVLRDRVRALLTRPPGGVPSEATAARHRRWLEPPFVPPAAAALARRAMLTDLPVLLVGERGTGTTDVARAIHFFAGGRTIVTRAAQDLGAVILSGDGRDAADAVVVEDVHRLSPDAQRALVLELREASTAGAAVRLFATTDVELEARVSDGRFAADLTYALGALPIALAPLRTRLADVPALVAALLPQLVARTRLEPVTLTAAALDRLQQYLWFGNVAELEAVLARTLAVHRPRIVEPEMLIFNAADAARVVAADVPATAPPGPTPRTGASSAAGAPLGGGTPPAIAAPAAPASGGSPPAPTPSRGRVLPLERRRSEDAAPEAERVGGTDAAAPSSRASSPARVAADLQERVATTPSLEVLLGELAHELRNPMVTIKTFAQHLDSVLDDPEVRARFATLTGEAIARMDTLLETLLDFSRFGTPLPRPVDLGALLARALDERADDLARKGARIEHAAPPGEPRAVEADEAQILFALRSLVDGLVRDLVAHAPVRIAARADGGVELRVHAERAIAARLASWVAGAEQDGDAVPPLAFALAAALVRRNHGRLDVRADDGETVITLAIAPRGGGTG